MFVTYPQFELPLQFDMGARNWTSVEVAPMFSWFLVTIDMVDEEVSRTFLVSREDDLIELALNGAGGRLAKVSLLLSPNFSDRGNWQMIYIRRLESTLASKSQRANLVLTDVNEKQYMGFPIAAVPLITEKLMLLAQFSHMSANIG